MLPNLIVPTLNRYDLLESMIDSIDYSVVHLLIIDNGGKLKSVKSNPNVRKVTILNMPSNLGVSSSWNLGIKSFPKHDRWFIASDDITFEPGAMKAWHMASARDKFIISDEWPFYQFIAVGDHVVQKVGLFDEAIHPANWEDDEYEWRLGEYGYAPEKIAIPHGHTKQGTVFSTAEFRKRNKITYDSNEQYLKDKKAKHDISSGEWQLKRRRDNSWD